MAGTWVFSPPQVMVWVGGNQSISLSPVLSPHFSSFPLPFHSVYKSNGKHIPRWGLAKRRKGRGAEVVNTHNLLLCMFHYVLCSKCPESVYRMFLVEMWYNVSRHTSLTTALVRVARNQLDTGGFLREPAGKPSQHSSAVCFQSQFHDTH